MRNKTEFKKISIHKDLYDRLKKDRKIFEDDIGGGRWSLSDVIEEYIKKINK